MGFEDDLLKKFGDELQLQAMAVSAEYLMQMRRMIEAIAENPDNREALLAFAMDYTNQNR